MRTLLDIIQLIHLTFLNKSVKKYNKSDAGCSVIILNSWKSFPFPSKNVSHDLDHEVNYLHGTDEREASEEPHGSSYS